MNYALCIMNYKKSAYKKSIQPLNRLDAFFMGWGSLLNKTGSWLKKIGCYLILF